MVKPHITRIGAARRMEACMSIANIVWSAIALILTGWAAHAYGGWPMFGIVVGSIWAAFGICGRIERTVGHATKSTIYRFALREIRERGDIVSQTIAMDALDE